MTTPSALSIEEFDALPPARALDVVLTAAQVPRWARAVVEKRPYGDREALLAAADGLARTWAEDEVSHALADHPRIGERHAGTGEAASHSEREQSAVAGASVSASVREAIAQGNRRYEERFGRIFLIRAAGRGPEEILAALTARLGNDDAAEDAVVAGELREIALLRLSHAIGPRGRDVGDRDVGDRDVEDRDVGERVSEAGVTS